MNCKDFREIADSYLSNELLVETNHDVLRHLESCAECRGELAGRRELREQLRVAVIKAPRSRIDPGFALRVKSSLHQQAFGKEKVWNSLGLRMVFAGVGAAILIAVAIGLTMQNPNANQQIAVDLQTPLVEKNVSLETLWFQRAAFVAAQNDALEDHKHCALTHDLEENPISLDKAAKLFGTTNKGLDLAVIHPLREAFGGDAKFLTAHFCLINGRRFSHVVVQYRGKVVSVLLTKREEGERVTDSEAISCKNAENFQVACFESGSYSVFVVSDLAESDNLRVAKTVSPSVKKHIEQNNSDV